MAKLTTQITGKVASVITISAAEVQAILREKFPTIPADAGMEVDTDLSDRIGLEAITFRWNADTSLPDSVEELKPAGSGCQGGCPRVHKHVMIPPPKDLMAGSGDQMGDCRPEADQVW